MYFFMNPGWSLCFWQKDSATSVELASFNRLFDFRFWNGIKWPKVDQNFNIWKTFTMALVIQFLKRSLKHVWVLYCLSTIFDNSVPIIMSLLNDFNSLLKGRKGSDILKRGLFIKEECDHLESHGLLVGKSPLFWNQLFLLGFTPCKAEQPLLGMDLQEKEAQNF